MKTIRELREQRGETQLQLAVALGVTPTTVFNWERGQHEPKASQLRALRAISASRWTKSISNRQWREKTPPRRPRRASGSLSPVGGGRREA